MKALTYSLKYLVPDTLVFVFLGRAADTLININNQA